MIDRILYMLTRFMRSKGMSVFATVFPGIIIRNVRLHKYIFEEVILQVKIKDNQKGRNYSVSLPRYSRLKSRAVSCALRYCLRSH